MKVQNMKSSNGNTVQNQFIIYGDFNAAGVRVNTFQSYSTTIANVYRAGNVIIKVELDRNAWNYSKTTSKYRNQFLGETTKETQAKIDSGEYILADLNK